jgi:hypothetical protein
MINSAIGSLARATLIESSVRLCGRVESSPWLPWSSAGKFTHPCIRQPEKKKWRRIVYVLNISKVEIIRKIPNICMLTDIL